MATLAQGTSRTITFDHALAIENLARVKSGQTVSSYQPFIRIYAAGVLVGSGSQLTITGLVANDVVSSMHVGNPSQALSPGSVAGSAVTLTTTAGLVIT